MTSFMYIPFTVAQKPTDELSKNYVTFVDANVEQIQQKIIDTIYVLGILDVSSFTPSTYSAFST